MVRFIHQKGRILCPTSQKSWTKSQCTPLQRNVQCVVNPQSKASKKYHKNKLCFALTVNHFLLIIPEEK